MLPEEAFSQEGSVAGFRVFSPHRETLQRWESPGGKTRPGVSTGREGALYTDVVVLQLPSCVRLFATPGTAAIQASLSFSISWNLLKFMSIESVMPSNHLILCRPVPFLPSILPSIRVFSNKSALHIRWPKNWSFSISPFNEYSGLISFSIDWFDLLAVHQGNFKSLLQHHSLKTSIFQCLVAFMIQLSHLCTTTGKTIVLTKQTFVGQVMSLLSNMLSRLVIVFLPRSKHLLILWLQ